MKRKLLWAALAIVVALGGAPFLKADRFGPNIQAGLEKALGRNADAGVSSDWEAAAASALAGPPASCTASTRSAMR